MPPPCEPVMMKAGKLLEVDPGLMLFGAVVAVSEKHVYPGGKLLVELSML